MMRVTLRQLRYFDALAREQHFGRAAEVCAVTQPALSMQIQELEEALGVPLVERMRTGLRLTPKGAEIAARAARILGEVQNLEDYAQSGAGVLSGPLRLGVIPSVAPYMLPPLLPLLQEAYPKAELSVRETQTAPLTRELIEGKLDVLFLALPVTHPDIATLPLFDDVFQLALPKDKKLSSRVRATPELVAHERLLLLEEGHCLRDQALEYCNLRQVDTVDTFGASSLSTLVEMVAAGYGITLLPEICIGIEARARPIALMRFAAPEPSRKLGLAWRATNPRAADFRALGDVIIRAWQTTHSHGA